MANVPKYIREGLQKQGPGALREIARMAENLADQKERELEAEIEENEVEADDRPDDLERDEAPGRATLTEKTIKGNRYYYYQWREGDKVKSEYIRPVNPD